MIIVDRPPESIWDRMSCCCRSVPSQNFDDGGCANALDVLDCQSAGCGASVGPKIAMKTKKAMMTAPVMIFGDRVMRDLRFCTCSGETGVIAPTVVMVQASRRARGSRIT